MFKTNISSTSINNSSNNKKKGILILVIPLFLLSLGLFIISYSLWNLFEQQYLIGSFFIQQPVAPVTNAKFIISNKEVQFPNQDSEFGILKIPGISLQYPIIQGTSDDDLAKGVGHHTSTALPGQGGNVLLAGHRDTVFRNLGKVKKGDTITIQTYYGTFTYKADSFKIIDKDDASVLNQSNVEVLTLYTCYPFEYIGHAPKRYVITCSYVGASGTKEIKLDGGKW